MSYTKRLDIQFGSFACSVQGFDDPVQPVQQVLQALQSLLEETPELADADISFDAQSIEQLIGEIARRSDIAEENVEIVPGLVIVHRAAAGDGDIALQDVASDSGAKNDEIISNGSGKAKAGKEADAEYVNIFSPSNFTDTDTKTGADPEASQGGGDGEVSDADPLAAFATDAEDQGGDDGAFQNDSFSARLAQVTEAEAEASGSRDLVTVGEDSNRALVRNVFADQLTTDIDSAEADKDTTIDFFSFAVEADKNARNTADSAGNMFTSTDLEELEPVKHLETAGRETPADDIEGGPSGQDQTLEEEDSERVATLFGATDDQPEVEETDDGYTAAGLAKTAEAKTVAELIVCAAAWMVLIQGQTTFSRKDVIKVFKTIPGEHKKTLEAQIKGFGKAVRDSQLVMIEDGVFGISRAELERFQLLL